jgi:peroxiredoxin
MRLLVLLPLLTLAACRPGADAYHLRMAQCLEQVETTTFTLEDGRTGTSYRNYDVRCLIGARLPDFRTEALDGTTYDNRELRGKINVINFWFQACKPCVAEMPGLNQLVEKYGPAPVNFLSLSRDEQAVMEAFLRDHDYHFTHLLNGRAIIQDAFAHKSGYPTTFVTDQDLRIVEIFTGGPSDTTAAREIVGKLSPVIDSLLAE